MRADYSLLTVRAAPPATGMSVTFKFYTEAPNVSGGGGGWQAVPRPQQNTVTAWRGAQDAYCMELNLILDTFTSRSGEDVEVDCRTLEKMCGVLTSPVSQPPLLILDANGALQNDVYNFPPLRWVISDPPTYGEVNRNAKGRRIRQAVTVKFMQYVAYDELTRTKTTASQGAPANTFIATQGIDTYKKAAARYLKSTKWASRLAQLNDPKANASTKLVPGGRYKLPNAEQLKDWAKTPRR
jgi:hypothetical protein